MWKNTHLINSSPGENEWKTWVILSIQQKEVIWRIVERKLFDYKNELSYILKIDNFNQLFDIYTNRYGSKDKYDSYVFKQWIDFIYSKIKDIISQINDYTTILEYRKLIHRDYLRVKKS